MVERNASPSCSYDSFSSSFGPVSRVVLASGVRRTSFQSCTTGVLTKRTSGISHPDALHWHKLVVNVVLSETSPIAMANVGWKIYLLFVCLNAVDVIIIVAFFLETKGKPLQRFLNYVWC